MAKKPVPAKRRSPSIESEEVLDINQQWINAFSEIIQDLDEFDFDEDEPKTPDEAVAAFQEAFATYEDKKRDAENQRVVEAERDILLRALTEGK